MKTFPSNPDTSRPRKTIVTALVVCKLAGLSLGLSGCATEGDSVGAGGFYTGPSPDEKRLVEQEKMTRRVRELTHF